MKSFFNKVSKSTVSKSLKRNYATSETEMDKLKEIAKKEAPVKEALERMYKHSNGASTGFLIEELKLGKVYTQFQQFAETRWKNIMKQGGDQAALEELYRDINNIVKTFELPLDGTIERLEILNTQEKKNAKKTAEEKLVDHMHTRFQLLVKQGTGIDKLAEAFQRELGAITPAMIESFKAEAAKAHTMSEPSKTHVQTLEEQREQEAYRSHCITS